MTVFTVIVYIQNHTLTLLPWKRMVIEHTEYDISTVISYGYTRTEVHYYSDLKYEGIIVGYCEIPSIPSDI